MEIIYRYVDLVNNHMRIFLRAYAFPGPGGITAVAETKGVDLPHDGQECPSHLDCG
jgi:hypothetical protein